jgi:hypothetical protein
MTVKIVLTVCLAALVLGTSSRADELAELKQQVELLQKRVEQLETKQKQQSEHMEEEIAKAVEEKQIEALPESLKWAEKIKISGDLRYRHEEIEAEGDDKDDRHRNRIRARLGINATLDEEFDINFRIASGSSDPVSTNQTLGEAFSTKDFRLDLAYFDWHRIMWEGFNVVGGKMKNPFYNVGKSELIWDGDLNPEGIAAKYTLAFSEHDKVHLTGGGFWAEESSSGVDQGLFGVQAYVKHAFENKSYLLGGASYYDFGNLAGSATLFDEQDGFGNTVVTSGGDTFYVNDYDIAELFGEYGFVVGQMPVAVFGTYVENTAARTSADTGWLIGCKLNKAKEPGSWELRYNYRELEKDAVLGVFTDSDFIGGGTDGDGHEFGINYQLAKNLQAGMTYFLDDRGANDDDYRRLQFDLQWKF